MTPSELDPNKPKYASPQEEITDLAGVRVITFFPRTVGKVDEAIREQFEIEEKVDHTASLQREEKLGYQSVHYVVKLTGQRTALPEYRKFIGLRGEIQVRTVMQHAWAEIEHDIQYKSAVIIPSGIKRRFIALAGLLEIADREFQAIQDADNSLREEARVSVQRGNLKEVEITPDALQTYLNKNLGSDLRISTFSYEWMSQVLLELGFTNLSQVQRCIAPYADIDISRIISGTRQGQLVRFEQMLLAGMGEEFIKRHSWNEHPWFIESCEKALQKLKEHGIKFGGYYIQARKPQKDGTRQQPEVAAEENSL